MNYLNDSTVVRAALACAVSLFINLTLPQAPQTEKALVDGRNTKDVTYSAQPWNQMRDFIECAGAGNLITTADSIGAGDFTIKAKIVLRNFNTTWAHLKLGGNSFCFDSRDRTMHVNGPLFGGNAITNLGPADKYLSKDVPFTFEVKRRDKKITFTLQNKVVYETEAEAGPIGKLSFEPGNNNTMRIYNWVVSGNLEAPNTVERTADEIKQFQARVDAAIDRGVGYLLRYQARDGSWDHHIDMFPAGQTALSAYTLLKCGLTPTHPALQRAFANLDQYTPAQTYVTSLMIMAYEATGDQRYKSRIQKLLGLLLGTEEGGNWSYPNDHGFPWPPGPGIPDLSNTQFAVLGLRSAYLSGAYIDAKVWMQILETVLKYQEQPKLADAKPTNRKPGATTTGKIPIAGFGYRDFQNPYGSMTAAGVCILAIAKEALGPKLSGHGLRTVNNAIDAGVNWLAEYFSVGANPRGGGWLYYYLYGLERIGALLQTDFIGIHDWYYEGGKAILNRQGNLGEWTEHDTQPDTCFALLFLRRATAPVFSGDTTKTPKDFYISESPTADVGIRAAGRHRLKIWISAFGGSVKSKYKGGEVNGLRVAKVEYLINGSVAGEVLGNPAKPWRDERFAFDYEFKKPGMHKISARVLVVPNDAPAGEKNGTVSLFASGFDMNVDAVLEDWMLDAATARGRNLLIGNSVTTTASTNLNGNETAARASDGYDCTRWLCAPSDAKPRLTLELQKTIKANTIVFGQAFNKPASAGFYDKITEVEIKINSDKPFKAPLDPDDTKPTAIALPKTYAIFKIEITITARTKSGSQPGVAGFSEVALEMRK
ncbi:MAG: hypothetical protein ACKVS6_05825 [Planctomycetota bacterium]